MSQHTEKPTCELCGEPMPPGEEMFKFHGYSGPCPKPIRDTHPTPPPAALAPEQAELLAEIDRQHGEELDRFFADTFRHEFRGAIGADHCLDCGEFRRHRNHGYASPPPARAEAPEGEREPYSEDLTAFVIGAFNEGWAAHESGEFSTLEDAYNESHVKLQLGIGDPHACDCRAEVARLTEALEQATQERDEARAIVAAVNNEVSGSHGYFTVPSCVEAIGTLKASANRAIHERDQQAGALVTLREALEKALTALPDSETAGPEGTGYAYAWDECKVDEQEWVQQIRADVRAAMERAK
jgi:hypothetical protein